MPDTKHIPLNLTIWKSWSPNLPHFLWFKQKEQWTRKLHFWKAFYKWMLTHVLLLIWIFVRNIKYIFCIFTTCFWHLFQTSMLALKNLALNNEYAFQTYIFTQRPFLRRACGGPPPPGCIHRFRTPHFRVNS